MGCGSSHAKIPNEPSEADSSPAEKAKAPEPATGPRDAAGGCEAAPEGAPVDGKEDAPADVSNVPAASTSETLQSQTPPATGEPRISTGSNRVDKQGRRVKQSQSVPSSLFQAVSHNGFRVIPEVSALVVSEQSLASFSLPAEALTFTPPEDAVITKFANGDQERKIHCNIRLSANELERLHAMRGEARAQGADFYPSVTAMATRFLSRARMDPSKAVKLMKETQEWRAGYFGQGPVSETEVAEDMKYGICYFSGRDCALRPAIIVRPARIPHKWYKEKRIDKLIRVLIFCVEYFLRYMVVPGRIENLSVIIDLAGLGVSQVPVTAVQEIYKVLSHHYIGRVYKFYVCNISMFLSTLAGVVRSLLTDRQRQKLNILDDLSELKKEFALHQLEQDLGGTRPKVAQFFPFPMCAGPYTAGYKGEPDANEVPDVHTCLTMGGALGRLWNPKETDENNSRLEFGPKAVDVLRRCNVPIPPELLVEREISVNLNSRNMELSGHDGVDGDKDALVTDPKGVSISNVETCSFPNESIPNDNSDTACADQDPGLQEVLHRPNAEIDSSVKASNGFFCCGYSS